MWIWEGHEKFIPVWIKWTRWRPKIQRDFPTEIRNSNVFSGRKQVISKKKGFHSKNVMKSGVSPQKLRKYWWKTPIWASICTPVAPSLLISSGHSPRLGGGHEQSFGGTRPRNAPPWRRACFAELISVPSEFSLMPRVKSSISYRNKAKIKLFLHKNKNFWVLGAPPPDPQWPPLDGAGAQKKKKKLLVKNKKKLIKKKKWKFQKQFFPIADFRLRTWHLTCAAQRSKF